MESKLKYLFVQFHVQILKINYIFAAYMPLSDHPVTMVPVKIVIV